ncbi:hypothetical protein GCM10022199_00750 [Marihabitans asiaticum]|uniref:Uncharacterized protein n=1 Tax=Marihabitans asiaticum TaxID=415218 RepID=A0A560WG18_9MICO|nr:hypothetical protein [Marihabitans asiaticum]TWD16643.1 hypothetical protein FB557_0174 [Marihabitans asiaticum]
MPAFVVAPVRPVGHAQTVKRTQIPAPGDRTRGRLIGVYNANGGLIGEAAYLIGKILGTAHCALCDITHSPVRRKKEWGELARRLPVSIELKHLDELTGAQRSVVDAGGAPVVLRDTGSGYEVLLDAGDLDSVGGDVAGFERLLLDRLGS